VPYQAGCDDLDERAKRAQLTEQTNARAVRGGGCARLKDLFAEPLHIRLGAWGVYHSKVAS
jgi:hypothetical protein